MTTLVAKMTDVQDRLDALARRHRVPGATLAIGLGDEVLDFATGVVNVDTGVETTTDSVFQIGSNTKLLTTTLVMQLVDEGRIDLDDPVTRHLPDFVLAERGAADEITVRHLLTHTSGIQGDWFQGFGRGDEAIERYVASLADIDLIHKPGEMWTYCNSAFVVAGRLAEVLTGKPYRELIRDRIAKPLGLRHMTVVVDEMVRHRMAVGHVPGPEGKPVVPPAVIMEYAQAPAGSMTVATAAELVRFVRANLDGGRTPGGGKLLSEASTRAMQQVQVMRPPTSSVPLSQGLGWLLEEWDGKRVIGHGGGTIGQLSFLHAIPEDDVIVALFTNSLTGGALWRDLGRWLFDDLVGVRMASPPKAVDPPPDLDLDRYAGVYERLGVRHRVEVDGDALLMSMEMTGPMAELQQGATPPPARLRPIDADRFAGRINGADAVVVFLAFERNRPTYLFAGRAARRTKSPRAAASKATVKAKSKATKKPANARRRA